MCGQGSLFTSSCEESHPAFYVLSLSNAPAGLINSGTSFRTACTPYGNVAFPSVVQANMMLERTVCRCIRAQGYVSVELYVCAGVLGYFGLLLSIVALNGFGPETSSTGSLKPTLRSAAKVPYIYIRGYCPRQHHTKPSFCIELLPTYLPTSLPTYTGLPLYL